MKASEAFELAQQVKDITETLELIKHYATKGELRCTTTKLLSPFQVQGLVDLGYTVVPATDPSITAWAGRGPPADRHCIIWGLATYRGLLADNK